MMSWFKSSPLSPCAGTPLAPKLSRVPLPDVSPDDDIILFMAKDRTPRSAPIKIPKPSGPPPVLKSCLKKRDPTPPSPSSSSSPSSLRSPPPKYRSREDVSMMSEAETSPTRSRHFRGRDLVDRVGVESDREEKKPLKGILKRPVAVTADPITLHWQLLAFNPHISRQRLCFDIIFDPHYSLRDLRTRRMLTEADYNKLASQPTLEEIVIRCEHGTIADQPWTIRVSNKGGIRCIDVFQAIHKNFAITLSDAEKSLVSPAQLANSKKAFRRRCEVSPNLPGWEQKQGMRRVDLLEGRTIFRGLSLSPSRNFWLLHLETLPA